MKTFFVSHDGQQMGPWGAEEIHSKLKTKALGWSDYVYDEKKEDWVFLMDHETFSAAYKAEKPSVAPSKDAPVITMAPPAELKGGAQTRGDKEWFVLKSDNRYGPFSYLEVIRMLQEKNLYEFDYVWNPSMAHWLRVAEAEEFKPDKIKALIDSGVPEVQEIFFRRRHARVNYGASIIIHNNKRVWKGESLEISSGGAGMRVQQSDFQPGQTLFLHFKPGDGVPPFNAICTIVSKQSKGSDFHYGVKFTSINRNVQAAIKDYTDNKAA